MYTLVRTTSKNVDNWLGFDRCSLGGQQTKLLTGLESLRLAKFVCFLLFYRNSSINILISDSNICSSTSPLILGNIHFLINTISETSRLSLSANHDRLEFYKIIENFKFCFFFLFPAAYSGTLEWSGVHSGKRRENIA